MSPLVPAAVGDYLVNAYVHLRSRSDELNDFQYTSARTLLSVIRLSTALARLQLKTTVSIGDVDEALRLIAVSKSSLLDDTEAKRPQDSMSVIFQLIKDMCMKGNGTLHREISYSFVSC